MKVFLKKIIRFFKSKKIDFKIIKRQQSNLYLRENKKSDLMRWSKNEELLTDWNERTLLLGGFINPCANIIEFGAGNMILKNKLNHYKSYTPTDIIKRFDETLVCDLNEPLHFDLTIYDTVVFSGVLEYVYDVDDVFKQLGNTINQVVLSYCCSDIVKLSRDKNGWLSDYKKNELEEIFVKYGFKIVNYTVWRNQSLYNLKKIHI